MDQSVAIQETLVEGEYCVIISFPVVGCLPDRACFSLGRWDGGCGKNFSLSHMGKGKPIFTKYSLGSGLFTRCFKYVAIFSTSCGVGDYYTHFENEESSER